MWSFRKARQQKRLEKAIVPCEQVCRLCGTRLSEKDSKQALLSFFQIYRTLSPERKAPKLYAEQLPKKGYYTAFLRILPVFDAVCKKHYQEACRELITLYDCEDLLQNRVYASLMVLFHKFLEE